MHLTTFTVALGDARYYVRKMFQDLVYAAGHEAAGEPDSDAMLAEETVFAGLVEELSFGKVIAISRGVYYDDANIPNGDSGKDEIVHLLVKFGTAQDSPVRMISIPQFDSSIALNTWFATNKASILDSDGTPASELVSKSIKTQKRARGSN